jgi:hypothetical protein
MGCPTYLGTYIMYCSYFNPRTHTPRSTLHRDICSTKVLDVQECGLLSSLPTRPQLVPGERNPALTLVGVTRLLRLTATQPEMAQRIDYLMDHVEDIKVGAMVWYTKGRSG